MPVNPFAVQSGLPPQPKPLFFQKVPKTDALADALIQGAYATKPQTPFEAVGKLAQLYAGTRQKDKYLGSLEEKEQAEKAKTEAAYASIRDALANGGDVRQTLLASEDPGLFSLGLKESLETPERKIEKDANGVARYIDTQEPVFPNAPPKEANPATFANITTVRKDFESQPGVSRYRTAAPILSSMASAVTDPGAMSDLEFVYGMAKIFDPDSVVRESEMGLVIQGQSVPEGLIGAVQKMTAGGASLGQEARAQLVEASQRRVGEYRNQAEMEATSFSDLAERYGIDPRDIVRPLEPMPEWERAPAVSGAAIDAPTATGPNGEKLILQNDQWVPLNGQ